MKRFVSLLPLLEVMKEGREDMVDVLRIKSVSKITKSLIIFFVLDIVALTVSITFYHPLYA